VNNVWTKLVDLLFLNNKSLAWIGLCNVSLGPMTASLTSKSTFRFGTQLWRAIRVRIRRRSQELVVKGKDIISPNHNLSLLRVASGSMDSEVRHNGPFQHKSHLWCHVKRTSFRLTEFGGDPLSHALGRRCRIAPGQVSHSAQVWKFRGYVLMCAVISLYRVGSKRQEETWGIEGSRGGRN
jgi:hypothetical protein